jgi:hypothetical protein
MFVLGVVFFVERRGKEREKVLKRFRKLGRVEKGLDSLEGLEKRDKPLSQLSKPL